MVELKNMGEFYIAVEQISSALNRIKELSKEPKKSRGQEIADNSIIARESCVEMFSHEGTFFFHTIAIQSPKNIADRIKSYLSKQINNAISGERERIKSILLRPHRQRPSQGSLNMLMEEIDRD